jgi:hypothetical protein
MNEKKTVKRFLQIFKSRHSVPPGKTKSHLILAYKRNFVYFCPVNSSIFNLFYLNENEK